MIKKPDILIEKIAYYTGIIEQSLEKTLNELISNNFKLHNVSFGKIFRNEVTEISAEIKNLALLKEIDENMGQGIINFNLPGKKKRVSGHNSLQMMSFTSCMDNIYRSTGLIRMNINEIYKRPHNKQALIPDLILTISTLFKRKLDLFFQKKDLEELTMTNEPPEEFNKILNRCSDILSDLSHSISERNVEDNHGKNHSVYYGAIVSHLEIIVLNIFNIPESL